MEDYSMDDLVRLSGSSARAIRYYIQRGLLSRPTLAGRATRYSRETLGRLAFIRHLRDDEDLALKHIKRGVREFAPGESEYWASRLDPGADAEPLALPPDAAAPLAVAERWGRVPLAPGLDLVLRDGASAEVVQLAAEIQAMVRARG
jgi:DNA-binding transcriptional MerR regulator